MARALGHHGGGLVLVGVVGGQKGRGTNCERVKKQEWRGEEG